MSLVHNIQGLQRTLQQSPILSLQKPLQNYDELLAQLHSYRKETDILLEKCFNPLKIVLMGEVKAGKSTLLNAFAGESVSPTNVTETTASIIEIKHASEKKGSLVKKSGETITGSPDKIYEILSENRGNQDFFSDVSIVKLEFALPALQKLHLVDTPGLSTVTTANEQTTIDFIQNSDVVLWVFSAHHLGQWDIEEQLANVKSYGKPIIAVINRLDEISGTAEELEMYIQQRLGFFVEEAFAISAYQAFEGIRTGNEELIQQSRYLELLAYLEENIEKDNKQVQEQSLLSSVKSLIDKERIQHQMVDDTITFLLQTMERRKEEIKFHNDSIKKKMKRELQNWVQTHFLDEEKRSLMSQTDALGAMSGKSSYQAISENLNKYVSGEYILELLEKKFSEMNEVFHEEWNDAIHSIGEKISMEEEEFRNQQISLYKNTEMSLQVYLPQADHAVKDGAVKGAAIGGAYGFAAATYAAVLGPSAASVTMGAALGALMPPVLIIGAITGIATKLVFGNKKKKEYSIEVMRVIEEAKQKVTNVFLPAMNHQLESESNHIADNLFEKLCAFTSQGWTEKELIELQQNLKSYKSILHLSEQELKKEAVGTPY